MSDKSIANPTCVTAEDAAHTVSATEHSDSGGDAALDQRFTDANHLYLATRKAEYLAGSRSKRRDVAQDAARHIIREIEGAGRQLQSTEKTALRKVFILSCACVIYSKVPPERTEVVQRALPCYQGQVSMAGELEWPAGLLPREQGHCGYHPGCDVP